MADYRRLTRQAARRYGLDPHIFQRQIGAESNFDPNARSKYAIGIAEFTPETARSLGVDPTKPRQSLNAAAKLMAGYVKKYGSYENALRAYNAGPGAIKASHGYSETNNYVSKILLGGRDPKRLGTATPGAGGDQPAGGAVPGAGNLPQGSEGLVPLLAALSAAKPQVASGTLQAPAASAAPSMPAGLQTPVSSGGPAPKPDMTGLLTAIQTIGGDITHAPGSAGGGGAGGGGGATGGVSGGRVKLDPNADRPGVSTNRAVVNFAQQVSAIAGTPVRIGTGTRHSRLTVDGNVSDHWAGNAADIPATGRRLIRLGQAALIAAGMPKSQARKQTGGLYNVGGHQVIFNTHEGGDHTNHLHISARKGRR